MRRSIGLAILLIAAAAAWEVSSARETPDANNIRQQSETPLERALAAYDAGDYASALTLFRPLAESGALAAQLYLGWMHEQGYGTAKDEVEATHWIRLAASQGYPRAQNSLGARHERGLGVDRDPAAAALWYRRAAEQGDAQAQANLARLQGILDCRVGLRPPRNDALLFRAKIAVPGRRAHRQAQHERASRRVRSRRSPGAIPAERRTR